MICLEQQSNPLKFEYYKRLIRFLFMNITKNPISSLIKPITLRNSFKAASLMVILITLFISFNLL
jgi:hypothetical protein